MEENNRCSFEGLCQFRNKCACSGDKNLLCEITYQISGIFFVDKKSHPNCDAKTYFGDTHICLCPAKNDQS